MFHLAPPPGMFLLDFNITIDIESLSVLDYSVKRSSNRETWGCTAMTKDVEDEVDLSCSHSTTSCTIEKVTLSLSSCLKHLHCISTASDSASGLQVNSLCLFLMY